MYLTVFIVEICVVCLLVHRLLTDMHCPQIGEIVGVKHRLTIGGIGELLDYKTFPLLGLRPVIATYGHKVEVIVYVKTVDIIRVSVFELKEFMACGREVLKFVLEDDAHIVETFLNHIVGGLYLLLGLGDLREIELDVMRIRSRFEGCFFLFGNRVVGGGALCVVFGFGGIVK